MANQIMFYVIYPKFGMILENISYFEIWSMYLIFRILEKYDLYFLK